MTREDIIQNIKDCGQSLVDNAEKICNDYKYSGGLTITCYIIERNGNTDFPTIMIEQELYPEKFIERYK
jgi:hypothetical protein